jgi:replication factor C subunit 1
MMTRLYYVRIYSIDNQESFLYFTGVDKYKPQTIKNLVGQQGEKSCVQKLILWLRDWYKHHNHSDEKVKAKSSFGFNRNEDPSMFKAALLSGPPGIGQSL